MPKNEFICDCHPINRELVERAVGSMPDAVTLSRICELFSMMGDKTRLKLLFALKESPLCVCDLANVLSMTKSSVSHQLKKLKNAGVVRSERNGKQIVYSFDDGHVLEIFETAVKHIGHKGVEL
jgi:ArsR family transcriptional regulator